MKKLILFLVSLSCLIPGLAFATNTTNDIHIEWSYDYQPVEGISLVGYHLYKEGVKVCTTETPEIKAMDCDIESESGTYSFTLTAVYSDATESPHSAPYDFTLEEEQPPVEPPPANEGSHSFTFSWETNTTQEIADYLIYLNNALLCKANDPTANEVTCRSDILQNVMEFTITTLFLDNTESLPSNLLRFDPSEYPQFSSKKTLTLAWEYPIEQNLAGFKIYQNNQQICETTNPLDRQLTCTTDITGSPTTFNLIAVNTTGIETVFSNTLVYSTDVPLSSTELKAKITSSTTSGPAPLTIAFDGASSTGEINSFSWSFGDGATSDTNNIDHQYIIPGTYTAQLTVSDLSGNTSVDTIAISVTEGAPAITPPQAVISSSTALGQSPFEISFNGEGSSAPNSEITLYQWTFGDGSSATGDKVSHSFITAGTFTTTLTVTNSSGLTDSISTPIIVTSPPPVENSPPQAVFSATPTSGSMPLTVAFNASSSNDPDGTISNYTWQFGDGSSASGVSATHTYTSQATFTATLVVTDNDGAQGSNTTTITVSPVQEIPDFNIELGEISVNSNWARVEISTSFQTPVVIAGPPGSTDSAPCVIRLRNISPTGFDIKITEWDYQDDSHTNETVSYIVMEKGRFTLPDGTQVEAGSFNGTNSFEQTIFSKTFNKNPVVVSTITSNNETETISGRIRNISTSSFDYYFREQEKNENSHVTETINFIAWEPSSGTIDMLVYEVQITPNSVTHNFYDIFFQSDFAMQPLFLADMQTTDGKDSSAVRLSNPTATSMQIKIEEEQSLNDEIAHTTETVGYLAFGSTEEAPTEPGQNEKQFTFTWEYDTEASVVSGFRFYLNNTLLCETSTPTDRTLSCTAPLLSEVMAFTMTAVNSNGTETMPSNLLRFDPAQFPQLSPTRRANFTWEFNQSEESNITGFTILINDINACETNDPTTRQLTCEIDTPQGETLFTIRAMNTNNTLTESSNVISHTP